MTIIVSGLALSLVARSRNVGGGYEIISDCYINGYMDSEAVADNKAWEAFEEMVFY